MAASFLCSPASVEIRQLVVHSYHRGIKPADAERLTLFYWRSGTGSGCKSLASWT